jgi:nucleotide-binding universal stress UspA family protein
MADVILCLTRGGTASHPNQDRAIAIAKERGSELLFLYITNVKFLDHTPLAKTVDLEAEMDEMGEFMLTMAVERAEREGVKARLAVRRGVFRNVIIEMIGDFDIACVVLGSSSGGTGIITEEYIHGLMDAISSETGVEFIVVDHGEVVRTYKS